MHYSFEDIIFDEWLNLLSSSSASFSSIVFLPAWWAKTSRSLYTRSKYSSVLQIQNIMQIDLRVHINFKYMFLKFFKFERLHAFPKFIMFFTENFYPLVQIQYTNNLSTCRAIIFSINWSNKTQMYIHVSALKLYTI